MLAVAAVLSFLSVAFSVTGIVWIVAICSDRRGVKQLLRAPAVKDCRRNSTEAVP